MGIEGITFNGQRYGSVEQMPPHVRREYEEVMRTVAPLLAGEGDTKAIPGTPLVPGSEGNIVMHRTITVDHRTFRSLDEMPPDVRRLFEQRIQGAGAPVRDPGKPGLSFSFHLGRSNVRPSLGSLLPETTRPIEPARQFLSSLVFWVVLALILWALLGR